MADRKINELATVESITNNDLFVLQQNETAKSLKAITLERWMLSIAKAHGGIKTIAKTKTTGLTDTYTITYSDDTTSTFDVKNGTAGGFGTVSASIGTGVGTPTVTVTASGANTSKNFAFAFNNLKGNGITSIDTSTSNADSGTNTVTINLEDGNSKSFTVKNGSKGSTGTASKITTKTVTYQVGSSGTTAPTGTWSSSVPSVAQGSYLWTKTYLKFNDNSEVTSYSVSRNGLDGAGSVVSVAGVSPDASGNVALSASDVGATTQAYVDGQVTTLNTTIATKEAKKIVVTNTSVSASDFAEDTTYSDFPYRASVAISGVTANMIPQVAFDVADVTSGTFAPVSTSYAGGVYIYASSAVAVTIPTIIVWGE